MTATYNDPSITLADLGIKVPAEVARANALADKVTELAYADVVEVTPHNTTPATVESDMRRTLDARRLRSHAQELSRDFDRAAREAVREVYKRKEVADRVLSDLAKAAKPRLALIAKAAEHLRPDDTAETVLARDEAAAKAWRQSEELDAAASDLRRIAEVTGLIASLRDRRSYDVPSLLWWVDVEDRNALHRLNTEVWETWGPGDGFLALIAAGHRPALATPHQAADRLAKIEAKEQAAAQALREGAFSGPMSVKQRRTQEAWLNASQ